MSECELGLMVAQHFPLGVGVDNFGKVRVAHMQGRLSSYHDFEERSFWFRTGYWAICAAGQRSGATDGQSVSDVLSADTAGALF